MKKIANLQDLFLLSARRSRVSVTIFLVVLESDGRQQMLYKHAISTIVPASSIDLKSAEDNGE